MTQPKPPRPDGHAGSFRPVEPITTAHIDLDAVGDDAAEFTRCLQQVRHIAGPLSNREIAARSGRQLSRWMVGEVLDKGALPKRDFLEAFLAVCGVPAPERARWDRIRASLAPLGEPLGPAGPAPAGRGADNRRQAEKIIEEAENRANEILALARDEVGRIMTQANLEAERARRTEEFRVKGAEDERDSAVARTLSLTLELDQVHEISMKRIKAADDERDSALARAQELANQMAELYETSWARIREAEEDRDKAQARARTLSLELEEVYRKIDELREKLVHAAKREDGDRELELEKAQQEIATLREELNTLSRAATTSKAGRYLDSGSDDIFSSSDRAVPPTIGA
ncbi:hypothetical protein [Amycolatopsis sp. lyj-109]|uniref:hypothetical protein n=1 Tax=Amycolatopsis sp. lyj-109 TaxID=2789287 RepID=UPI00397A0688